jgi:hypothetical protein
MTHRWTAWIVTAGLFLFVGSVQPFAGAQLPEKGMPVPEHAKVAIELDRKEYFLGENVLLHFCIKNTGTKPFSIELGGDYRFASRSLRFKVAAFDAAGKLCEDPDPSGFSMGGLVSRPVVEPGAMHYESIPLLRYRRIEHPGVYKIQVAHGLGWTETSNRKLPVAETTIQFVKPSTEQASKLVETMLQGPEDNGRTSGKKSAAYADFSVLGDPVYLPILLEHARKKSAKALEGIGSIATPRATEALIQLAGNDDAAFALSAVQTINMRLPDPQLDNELPPRNPFLNDQLAARRWLMKRSWRPRLADDVAELARKFLLREDRQGLECGGYMMQCVGRKEDLPHLIRALDREIAAAAKRPFEENEYPRPRGACRELLRAAQVLSARAATEPLPSETAGQAVVFLCAVGTSSKFRPDGWQRTYARLLQHDVAFVREVALDQVPLPLPEALLPLLPRLITDKDVEVAIAACHVAEKTKRKEWKGAVLKALSVARERWHFRAANNAAFALDARWEQIEILVARLDEAGMTGPCLINLLDCVVENVGGHVGPSEKWTAEDARVCKERWQRFLRDHGQRLKDGQYFRRADPAITPDLFPTMKLGS